jgi:conjugal transfer pilus assembly protein TraK
MFHSPSHKRLLPAAIALAVTLSLNVTAQERVPVPGVTFPVSAASAPVSTPTAPSSQPEAKTGTSPSATVAPKPAVQPEARQARLVQVDPADADLPAVPASVIRPTPPRRPSEPVETRQDVVVNNGTNTLIPISKGQINRIVTPFESPEIQTVSSAEIYAQDNVIYVTTTEDQPVTMFITPEDDEAVAISLTLLPQSIPPIQANLLFSQSVPGSSVGAGTQGALPAGSLAYSGQAKRWERSQPFMDTLRNIMRELALGNLPRGYSFAQLQSGDSVPDCVQQGVNYDFSNAQYVLGHDFRIFIVVAENNSAQHLEIDHGACTHPNRAAVAVWPHEILEPGQKTEVFLVTRIPQVQANTSTRPSLLN